MELDRQIEALIENQLGMMAGQLTPEQRKQQKAAMLQQFSGDQQRLQFLNSYIVQEILYRKARALKLTENPSVRAQLREAERSLLARQVMDSEMKRKILISETDVAGFFAMKKEDYFEPAWAALSHIVVADEETAKQVIARILAGEEFAELARELDGVPGVSALEVNVSCPNLDSGGMEFGVDPVMTAAVTDAVRQSTTLPVIVKLTPNVTDIVPLAQAAESAGAHALCVANSFLGTSIDVETRRTRTHRPMSGLTGPAIRPLAVRLVWQTAQAVSIPIIGCGGITSSRDALEFLLAGASIVQVGTATFSNPYAPLEVLEGIEAYCREHDVGSLSELVGAALPRG